MGRNGNGLVTVIDKGLIKFQTFLSKKIKKLKINLDFIKIKKI